MSNIYGENFQMNFKERHIESLDIDQVLACLDFVLFDFKYVDHWKNHSNRQESAALHKSKLEGENKEPCVPQAKDFLRQCVHADVFRETDKFCSVGNFEFLVYRRGKPNLQLTFAEWQNGRPGQWEKNKHEKSTDK